MKLIEVEGVNVSFNKERVLSDITFDVEKKDFLGILGQNGSGKSTLIKALLGLVPIDSGTINFFGNRFSKSLVKQKIGYLPQKSQFSDPKFPATSFEVICSGIISKMTFPKRVQPEHVNIINRYLKLLNIEDLKNRQIGKLSGGQQQKVLLARAMVSSPSILILDEPTASLDQNSRNNFYDILKELNEKEELTILIVSHDSVNIKGYINKMICLDNSIVYCGGAHGFHYHGKTAHYF